MKKRVTISRRQVLRGSAGVVLGLPFLPSLVPGKAYAQSVTFAVPPRFCALTTNHGGMYEAAMFPGETALSNTLGLYPGLEIRSGALSRVEADGLARVSEVLSANPGLLSERLVSKMNVLFGLDIPFYIGHHTGGHLGNFARNDGNGADGQGIQKLAMPTIDQIMAWSSSFYQDLTGVTARSLVCGSGRFSWGYSNPSAHAGSIQEVRAAWDAPDAFDQVFPNGVPSPPPEMEEEEPERPLIVDRVVQAYRDLRQGSRRLSSADRQRLDDHMDRLMELQRRVNTFNVSCQDAQMPARVTDPVENSRLLVEVAATALICGATRVAVIAMPESRFVSFGGDWHQDVAHQWDSPKGQELLRAANRGVFSEVMVPLAAALDAAEDAPGQSVLDSTLMTWSQESGMETHEARSLPVVTFGGAQGFLNTGLFCDFRNRTDKGMRKKWGKDRGYSGLLYNQWLATCLLAMGVPQSEWQGIQHNGSQGYGVSLVSDDYAESHVTGVVENASQPLPLVSG